MQLKDVMPEQMSTPAKLYLGSNLLNGFGNGIANVIIGLYLLQLGFGAAEIGFISMLSSLGMFLFLLPSGVLADRYGKAKIMVASWIPMILFLGMLLATSNLLLLSVAWFLNGIGNAAGNASIGPFFSTLFKRKDMDKAFGLRGFLNIISMSMGSLVGFVPPYLVNNYGFTLKYSYWLMILLASIIFIAQIPFYWKMFKYVKEEKRENGLKFNIKSKEVVVKYSIIEVIQRLALGPFSSMLTFFVNKKFGVESDALGAMQFISYFVQAGSNLLSPKISNRFGSVKTITTSLVLASPFFALFTVAPSFFWISIIYITRLGIASICNPLMPSLFYKLLHEEEMATANSIASMASNGTSIFTPRIGAYLVDTVSINAPALLAALMYPIFGATFYYFFKNLKPPSIEIIKEVTN